MSIDDLTLLVGKRNGPQSISVDDDPALLAGEKNGADRGVG